MSPEFVDTNVLLYAYDPSASVLGCSVLWTEDLNPGQRIADVEAVSPFS